MFDHASIVVLAGAALLAGPGFAADRCSASSAPQRLPVVELYTSEGCSSCPPADRWLSSLTRDAKAGRLLPLAFHVDYWDYIGWKDGFAQSAFSRRQRELADQRGVATIYTPQVVVDTRDFLGWRDASAFEASLASAGRQPPGARLSLDLRLESASRWKVDLRGNLAGAKSGGDAFVFLAVYENGLETRVRAGENAGATLRHDHVVRNWLGPFHFQADGAISKHADIAIEPGWKPHNLGIAALAFSARGGEVLQAVSLPSCVTPRD
ncbi:MAG: DUF1223 domain-containing protein [Sterolibacteriaceae bacterium]|uniref:DUF1223 domain-containing protein n=1 Tax=Candidatus Methylophosphatis roskildensis TaxID=2899263 RepID=A0A9D7E000_9PROT|nr:DUF1223 domain-containing protein [Candidatus Methylophosphatis roskildensis]MBK7234682.1 DUF1223 domain-containing protein [Sterolibacteriaceae bacterium]